MPLKKSFKRLQDSIIKESVETGNITMIQVVGSSGELVSINMNEHTLMCRALDAYANEIGQERHTIRFHWAGVWISNTDTPGTLNMKDNEIMNAINQCRHSSLNPDVKKPSQSESSSNSTTTTPFMDSPRSRNHSPSSLEFEREEEKEKRAAEEKEAEKRARKLAEEKSRTVAAKQAQREKEENFRKPAVE
ncbi:MAG: hypothetical protein NXY57DRAFT_1074989 [Lentinula lateritia]|nr:MAG: hypothetical protein NXY57DRAFT_1074989 [Lentinula lateritia]